MIPALMDRFNSTANQTVAVISYFSVAYGIMQLFFGPLSERIGKYRLIAWTTLACALGSFCAFLSSNLHQLILARLLSGATAAGIIPLSMAWIGDTTPYEQRQATLARFLGGQIIGIVGGQFIGGAITDLIDYHWTFGFMTVIYLVIGALVLREVYNNPLIRQSYKSSTTSLSLLVQWQKILGITWARRILITVFIEGALVFGPLSLVPTFLHRQGHLSLTKAGLIMATFGVGGFGYTLLARRFVTRFGESGLSRLGSLALGCAWLILTLTSQWGWAIVAGTMIGFGYYLLHNTLQTHATQMAPNLRGTAVSLFASLFFLGQSLGVVLSTTLYTLTSSTTLFMIPTLLLPLLGQNLAHAIHHRHPVTEPTHHTNGQ